MLSKGVAFFFVVGFAIVFGAPSGGSRIAGGSLAEPGQFPYVVSVTLNGEHHCGGLIYSNQWVVTTAACVDGQNPSQLKVIAGQFSLIVIENTEQIVPVFRFTVYDSYNASTGLNDVALLELSRPLTFGPSVDFIYYDEYDDRIPITETMGWGATTDGGLVSSKLRFAAVTIAGADCSSFVNYNPNYEICGGVGGDNGTPCIYDEGNPLVQKDKTGSNAVAIGILSKFSPTCDSITVQSSVYTKLSVFYAWMSRIAGPQPIRSTTPQPTNPPSDPPIHDENIAIRMKP